MTKPSTSIYLDNRAIRLWFRIAHGSRNARQPPLSVPQPPRLALTTRRRVFIHSHWAEVLSLLPHLQRRLGARRGVSFKTLIYMHYVWWDRTCYIGHDVFCTMLGWIGLAIGCVLFWLRFCFRFLVSGAYWAVEQLMVSFDFWFV